jgi:UDP-N-acetylmuramyl pentapeptide phosphotransferase/UDP-N-acetylglucosamine-1-phosphate transferase
MGGGMFGTPLYLNPKCLVFSAFVLAVYWMPHAKPLTHRIVTAFMLATLAYVLLAWYDMIYDCNDKLGPTILGWISMPFKPASYRNQFEQLPVKYQKIVQWTDILVLSVLLVLFAYPFIFTK